MRTAQGYGRPAASGGHLGAETPTQFLCPQILFCPEGLFQTCAKNKILPLKNIFCPPNLKTWLRAYGETCSKSKLEPELERFVTRVTSHAHIATLAKKFGGALSCKKFKRERFRWLAGAAFPKSFTLQEQVPSKRTNDLISLKPYEKSWNEQRKTGQKLRIVKKYAVALVIRGDTAGPLTIPQLRNAVSKSRTIEAKATRQL